LVGGFVKVHLNGLFTEHPLTGSGQYLRHLHRALVAAAREDEFTIVPRRGVYARLGRRVGKVLWEQIGFPTAAVGADLAHVPYLGPPLRGRNDVVTVHDLIGMVLPEYAASPWMRLYNRAVAAAARRARLILADSQATADDVQRLLGIGPERIRVTLLGVDEDLRPAPAAQIADVRDHHGLPERFALYLGSGDVRKNLDVLLRAWALLPAAERIPLVLAGNIPCRGDALFPDYRRLAEQLGVGESIAWLGTVPEAEKATLLSAATVFVFPSRYEGFGLDPLEAMACGTPVICSDATSLPEVVGAAAVLVDPADEKAWAVAVGSVAEGGDHAAELVAAGRARAAELTWRATAELTLNAYRELL
jgi:glycosyltransferase involved in cell wall biosynthesis